MANGTNWLQYFQGKKMNDPASLGASSSGSGTGGYLDSVLQPNNDAGTGSTPADLYNPTGFQTLGSMKDPKGQPVTNGGANPNTPVTLGNPMGGSSWGSWGTIGNDPTATNPNAGIGTIPTGWQASSGGSQDSGYLSGFNADNPFSSGYNSWLDQFRGTAAVDVDLRNQLATGAQSIAGQEALQKMRGQQAIDQMNQDYLKKYGI